MTTKASATRSSARPGAERLRHKLPEIRDALARWITFTVAFAVLPVGFNALFALTRGGRIGYEDLVAGGELLLVSAAILAAAAGELSTVTARPLRSTRSLLMGTSIFAACTSSGWFAYVASAVDAQDHIDRHAVAVGSTALFASALVIGACCMALSRLAP